MGACRPAGDDAATAGSVELEPHGLGQLPLLPVKGVVLRRFAAKPPTSERLEGS